MRMGRKGKIQLSFGRPAGAAILLGAAMGRLFCPAKRLVQRMPFDVNAGAFVPREAATQANAAAADVQGKLPPCAGPLQISISKTNNSIKPARLAWPAPGNLVLAFPFIAMPVISCILQYAALYTGLCPLYGATQVPWTCPPIISGFLIGGWRTALLQLVIFVLSFFIYLPFARRVDKLNLVKEAEAEKEAKDDDW